MAKMQYRVRSVIFDLDGVITNTMPDHFIAWKTVLKEAGIDVTYEDIYCREGQDGLSSVKEIFHKYRKNAADNRARKILLQKENLFKKITKKRYISGSRAFLRHLHSERFDLALVTGTARHELDRILPVSVRKLFSVIVTGSDVKNGKPHPEPYLASLNKLGINPCDAVAIENAPFGIRSAKNAGLPCLALETSLPRTYLAEADAVFSSFKDLTSNVVFLN